MTTIKEISESLFDQKLSPRERAEILVKALPETIRIGPHDYRLIVMSPVEAEQKNIYGHHSPFELVIRIAPSFPSATRAASCLLHECLHALFDSAELHDDDKEERLVAALATGLVGLLRDNAWLAGWLAGAVK